MFSLYAVWCTGNSVSAAAGITEVSTNGIRGPAPCQIILHPAYLLTTHTMLLTAGLAGLMTVTQPIISKPWQVVCVFAQRGIPHMHSTLSLWPAWSPGICPALLRHTWPSNCHVWAAACPSATWKLDTATSNHWLASRCLRRLHTLQKAHSVAQMLL